MIDYEELAYQVKTWFTDHPEKAELTFTAKPGLIDPKKLEDYLVGFPGCYFVSCNQRYNHEKRCLEIDDSTIFVSYRLSDW